MANLPKTNPAETEEFAVNFLIWVNKQPYHRSIVNDNQWYKYDENGHPIYFTAEKLYSEFIKETIF